MRGWFWLQLIAFQLIWFSAVLGRNDWLLLSLLLIAVHFAFSPTGRSDWQVAPIALIGIGADALLTLGGVFDFDGMPWWLALVWIGFVLSLGHSLAWLRRLPLIALAPMGALAGTASYLAGWRLDAVELPLGLTVSVMALAILWSILLPVLVRLDFYIRSPAT
jgi:hypothetical protein